MYLLQQIKTKKNSVYIAGGLSSAFLLFFFMYLLILPGDLDLSGLKDKQMVDFIRLKKDGPILSFIKLVKCGILDKFVL